MNYASIVPWNWMWNKQKKLQLTLWDKGRQKPPECTKQISENIIIFKKTKKWGKKQIKI